MTSSTNRASLIERLEVGPVWSDGEPIGAVVGEVNGATMSEAADLIQSLSDRIAVLEGERNEIGYHAEQLATYIAQSSISEKHLASARFHNDKIRASLIEGIAKPGATNG
jgi:hypothetical protein